MGLVMQEPTLFNYTIQENILYGKSHASNSQLKEAAEIANALEFIESQSIFESVEDSIEALLKEFVRNESTLKQKLGDQVYGEKLELLK